MNYNLAQHQREAFAHSIFAKKALIQESTGDYELHALLFHAERMQGYAGGMPADVTSTPIANACVHDAYEGPKDGLDFSPPRSEM
jgi:hypothetical protein